MPGPKTIYTLMQTETETETQCPCWHVWQQQRTYGDVLVLKSHGRPSGRGPVANLQDGPQENSQQALHDELHLLWHHGLLQRGEKTHTHREVPNEKHFTWTKEEERETLMLIQHVTVIGVIPAIPPPSLKKVIFFCTELDSFEYYLNGSVESRLTVGVTRTQRGSSK